MILFYIFAFVMIVIALALLLPTLLGKRFFSDVEVDREKQNIQVAKDNLAELEAARKDGRVSEEQYSATRSELESLLAIELENQISTSGSSSTDASKKGRWTVGLVGILLPVAAIWIYTQIGTPVIMDQDALDAITAQQQSPETPDVEEMVSRLEDRLKDEPDNAQGWLMLGRSYKVLGRYDDAVEAIGKALEMVGEQPDIMLQYADALAMSNESLAGKPAEMIEKALKLAPDNPTALWLGGMVAADNEDFSLALSRWKKAEPLLSDEPDSQATLHQFIRMAEEQLGQRASSDDTSVSSSKSADISGSVITVHVSLLENQALSLTGEESVYIFAQAMSGPPMPLAVAKVQVKELPLTVQLNDSMAMTPQLKLSNFDHVNVVARVSLSGQAIPQSGDIQGKTENVGVAGGEAIDVVMDTILP